jgi:two-component system, chemotaxis family, sensor kinase CheA
MRDTYKYFRIEARELLDQLNQVVLELEKVTTSERVAHLLRLAHTLKGAARVVKRTDIGDLAHAIEDAVEPLRGSEQQATRSLIDTLLRYLDDIDGRVASLTHEVQSPTPGRAISEEVLRTVRVDIAEMDMLLDGFAEVHARLGGLRESLRQSGNIRSQIDILGTELTFQANTPNAPQSRKAEYSQAQAMTEQLGAAFDNLSYSLNSSIEQFDRELNLVRDAAERMRLIRAENLFGALERVARDAAQVLNKKVVFEGRGGDVRLDAQVLGAVQDALSHVVRNAVVHGIETPAQRQAVGKSAEGRVVMSVSQRGRWIVFTCTDDGRGIDLAAIRRIAEQRASLSANKARTLDNDALVQLLLKGGISTSEAVTEVSGRGVGLDVVRDSAEQLDGKIEMHTEVGRGTTLTLTVPLLIASLDGLLVETMGVVATIPIDAVRRTLRLAPSEISRTSQGEMVIFEGSAIPFLPLNLALSIRTLSARGNSIWSAVVVETDSGAAAIGVDRLLGVANVLLRPLPTLVAAKAIVTGVSLNLEGNPQLVLDPAHLVIEAQAARAARPDSEETRYTVLVVDDSLTTRMLERSILESAGYVVELAVSGEEAMEKAIRNRYALFLVDVEMPGMDGFTFIERVQANPALRDTPAILVTSRASVEDRQRGRDVGARGYIVKSEFDQGVLLARIDELVRR